MAVVALADPEEVRHLLRAAQDARTDPQARFCVETMIGQGTCWKIVEDGAITGAMLTTEEGGDLWISIAAGKSPSDLVDIMAAHLIEQAGCRYAGIGFRTSRKGLVKKAMRHGYEIEAFIMRKKL